MISYQSLLLSTIVLNDNVFYILQNSNLDTSERAIENFRHQPSDELRIIEENRKIREEQDLAYAQSLKQDQEKDRIKQQDLLKEMHSQREQQQREEVVHHSVYWGSNKC